MVEPFRYHDSTSGVAAESGLAVHQTVSLSDSRRLVVSSIRDHAERRPDSPAVVDGSGALTYRQLYDRAGGLAARLAELAPGTDDVTAVYLPRGAGLVIAALAALLAGRPYLLIDVEQPGPRVAHMLSDSKARVVVTDEPHRAVPSDMDVAVVLDDSADVVEPPTAARPSELAYLCYTSGSSGLPKGVRITHHGLANLVTWYTGQYGITPADRMTQLVSPSFDAWVLEVWPCLAAGAALYIADSEVGRSPERLRDWLLANGITVSFVATPLAVELLATGWPASTALRAMLVGGDRLARPPAEKPPFRVFNNYGPTECTVVATVAEVLDFGSAEPPPIGRPIPSVRAVVVGPDGAEVPTGEIGELHLGGPAMAAGYVGDVGDSALRFVPDPGVPGASRYRTGDLVRMDAHGDLHFVGRADDQIKVNGVRIEPGEVENVLLRHPDVRAAAVVLHHTPDDADHLVAYVVADGTVDEQAVRRHAAAHLPKQMTPHVVVPVDALPLTPHGKLDRGELARRPLLTRPAGAPSGTAEATLRDLWVDVLRVPDVQSTDDFFDLGGDSLRALRFINNARKAGITLVPEDLYTHSVLSDLARVVSHGRGVEGDG